MKKITSLFLALVIVCGMSGCLAACNNYRTPNDDSTTTKNNVESRNIVDMRGNTISVPKEVDSYIVLWKSYTGILAMLDGCSGLKGCDYDVTKDSDGWLFEICPNAKQISIITEEITAEEVGNLDVDVVFWQNSNCEDLANQLNDLGIAAVNVDFTDYETMKESVSLAAEVLNTSTAKKKAEAFNAYLDNAIESVTSVTKTYKDENKLTIINLRKVETLRADGKGTVADTWINAVGALNLVSENNLSGNQFLEIEQIYEWDPDIIVSSVSGDDSIMYSEKIYSPLRAVKNNHVYVNPYGIFAWNRYSVETPLQLYWAASTFYPEDFSHINIREETKSFYNDFFDYEISNLDVEKILTAKGPNQ